MGTGNCGKKARHSSKKKQYKKALCTKRRPKDVDQIQVRVDWMGCWMGLWGGQSTDALIESSVGRSMIPCIHHGRPFSSPSHIPPLLPPHHTHARTHPKDELRKEAEVGKKTAFEWDDDLPGCVFL